MPIANDNVPSRYRSPIVGEVIAFKGKGKFPKERLIDLATNPKLDGFQIVCH
jgi:hypothetical protein